MLGYNKNYITLALIQNKIRTYKTLKKALVNIKG